jgi:amino acid adenylation domain-containing protein
MSPHVQSSNYKLRQENQDTELSLLYMSKGLQEEYSSEKTLVDLLQEQFKLTPDKTALILKKEKLTYRELDERSSQLGNYLRDAGVVRDGLVGVCLDRSFEMIIAIIGILKAGGAYVPIDPAYPIDRMSYIINDTGKGIIISSKSIKENLTKISKNIIVALDSEWDIIEKYSTNNPKVNISISDLAYIIYTSGSTGKPKGVMLKHSNIVCYLSTCKKLYVSSDANLSGSYCYLTYTFDASLTALFLPLISGKQVVICSTDGLDVFEDPALNANAPYDFIKITPAHLGLFKSKYQYSGTDFLTNLLIIGGEELKSESLHGLASNLQLTIINEYGPTECTIGSTIFSFKVNDAKGKIPIGKPLPNTSAYILNSAGQLQPVGIIGELYLGGPQVARGYLNRSDLTELSFINNPYENGTCLYRTGDICRWMPDGNIEFLGRSDDQVKIHGHRIEMGEIENTILSSGFVKECVVVIDNGTQDDNRLVVFMVPYTDRYELKKLKAYLNEKLPYYMIPLLFVEIDTLPLTANGKIDKKALIIPDPSSLLTNVYVSPKSDEEKRISSIWKMLLNVKRVGTQDNFFDLGGTSLLALKVIIEIQQQLNYELPISKLYQYPTIAGLTKYIDKKNLKRNVLARPVDNKATTDIAIIGMAGRFPGANAINELWDLLVEGRETTTFFTEEEIDKSIPNHIKNDPTYIKARGIINDAEYFDSAFFGINPKLAELMDPQQRVFLEIAWEILEQTGHLPSKYPNKVGVFAGAGTNTYYENNVLPYPAYIEKVGKLQVGTVNEKDYLASRTAYHLNLTGPAISINSACSTSLLAIATAVNSLRSGQCDAAIAGGSSITSPIKSGHVYQEGSILSADGHCKPFDNDSTGTVFSDGAGVVLLKRLDDAIHDGDTIYAVIKGIGVNNDGFGKGSFTAPSSEGQANAIESAMMDAGIEAADISYIEAHGTGTPIGDPIEIDGLMEAFGEQDKKQYCAIGSIKSNFGHLTQAAGVAGLIKTCLSLYNKKLLPSIGVNQPNKSIDFLNSPFFVNDKLTDWHSDKKRIAGVSSFGVGGTNVHVIVEEYENPDRSSSAGRSFELVNWSANSEKSTELYAVALAKYANDNTDASLADIGYSLKKSRNDFRFRRFAVASSIYELGEILAKPCPADNLKEMPSEVVFTFPGQGAQYLNMGADLYKQEPVYKAAIDECAGLLQPYIKVDIRDIIFPAEPSEEARNLLSETRFTQPALFIVEYALTKLWMSWGIIPTLLCGHSIGEYVAAHFAGIFSLQDALKIIATRGSMVNDLPPGCMLSVRAEAAVVLEMLPQNLCIAAVNGPKLCVVAGPEKEITQFSDLLTTKQLINKLLFTSHAFHSAMMDPIVADFKEIVSQVSLSAPTIPIISTVTGNLLTNQEATDPDYWSNHLRLPVQFLNAIDTVLTYNLPIFLEAGPGAVTSTLIRQIAANKKVAVTAIASLNGTDNDTASLLNALGKLWSSGLEPDWANFYSNQQRQLIDLPAYQFDRNRYWTETVAVNDLVTPTQSLQAPMQHIPSIEQNPINNFVMRKDNIAVRIKQIFEDASGIEMNDVKTHHTFHEIGLDSLLLTQVAISLKKEFGLPITFRKLNEEYYSIDLLADYLDKNMPAEAFAPSPAVVQASSTPALVQQFMPQTNGDHVNNSQLSLITQQLELLAKQVMLLQGNNNATNAPHQEVTRIGLTPAQKPEVKENELTQEEKTELAKPFGATPKIERQSSDLNQKQLDFIKNLTLTYNAKTIKSKQYTDKSRPYMADPRVVSGFRPTTKELIYPIVINKSKGSKLVDLDGNEYIDALNGFGSNLLGYQPEFIKNAMHSQIENGYEVGPQHELAAEVSQLICEFTGFDRAALCSTGSEAVLGCIRIARTVTARSLIVAFTGSYHGIIDEVLVRGSKKLKSFPAAAGIMSEAVQNILVLDYGTDETLAIIKERANEIAAVLVEPVQSRRPEFVPIEFLKKLREITTASGSALIFDEVITGFRMHPGGAQAMFNIKADIASYGKVLGAGIPIGVIAGKKEYMDALDGGTWQYGDRSFPEVGVTYFAGTFVRHPLALISAKATLTYMKERGPNLQLQLNAKGAYISARLNKEFEKRQLPAFVANFGSLWKVKYHEEIPYSELMFVLMREKGIHILDGFPCFITEAMSDADIERIISCFIESMNEMVSAGFFPSLNIPNQNYNSEAIVMNADNPPVKGAKLGKDRSGNPAWFIQDPMQDGKYFQFKSN